MILTDTADLMVVPMVIGDIMHMVGVMVITVSTLVPTIKPTPMMKPMDRINLLPKSKMTF